jgi:formamidopyrimidine-DNA glycosylase
MPELPEVETVRRALTLHIIGKVIERIEVRDSRLRWPVDQNKLQDMLLNRTITDITRRAKYLLIHTGDEKTLIIHLGMTGQLLYMTTETPFAKHEHVVFRFSDNTQLRFRDTRRFGMIDAVAAGELRDHPRLANLGLEPLSRQTTGRKLFQRAANSKKPVKNLIMDAAFLVGIGNIYANEALYYAGIHPATSNQNLQEGDWQRLMKQIRRVLRKAISRGGTTLNDFVDSNGESGYFQLSLAVYNREKMPCLHCGTEIRRIVMTGRSTYFCPVCQKMKR